MNATRLVISQHWFRWWRQKKRRYLNQCWHRRYMAPLDHNELTFLSEHDIFCRLMCLPRRHGAMMTSSNGKISALLALCVGNSPVNGELPSQRPVTRSFDVFFDLGLQKVELSNRNAGDLTETPSCSAHYDATVMIRIEQPIGSEISGRISAPESLKCGITYLIEAEWRIYASVN